MTIIDALKEYMWIGYSGKVIEALWKYISWTKSISDDEVIVPICNFQLMNLIELSKFKGRFKKGHRSIMEVN